MMENIQGYKIPVIISVLLHIVIFALLFLHFSSSKIPATQNVQVIQAVTINESQLTVSPKEPVKSNLEPITPKVKSISKNTIQHIEQLALKQQEQSSPAIPLPSHPSPKVVKQEQPDLALQEPVMPEKVIQKKPSVKKTTAELKQKENQLLKKRQEEEAKQLQKELAIETRQQESQLKEEESATEEQEKTVSKDIAEQLNAEKKELTDSKAALAQAGEIDKYKQMIIQNISRKWLIPNTENKEATCQVLVHVGPGGVVLSVDFIKESGDANLDRSARNAIMKASPLPVPESSELFDNFRALRLTFRPQGIISS